MADRIYGGVTADVRRSERQRRLLDAALTLIGAEGAGGLTLRKVAATAGVSPRYVYESFADLAELRSCAFDATVEEFAGLGIDAVGRASPDLQSQLGAMVHTLTDFADTRPEKAKLLLVDSLADAEMAPRRQLMLDRFVEGFAGYLASHFPEADHDRIHLTARLIVGGTAEASIARLRSDSNGPLEQLEANLTTAFIGTIDALLCPGARRSRKRSGAT